MPHLEGEVMFGRRLRAALCISLSLGITNTALPQQPTPQELTNPAVRVTTRLVLADVVVTDKSGQRVKGLTQSDFTILENGKPQKISTFSFESRDFQPAPRPTALPENVYTNRPEYDMPPGPLVIMLLDGINTPVADQGYARSQMLRYLGTQVQPGQPIAAY